MTRMIRPCVISDVNVGTPFCAYTSFVGLYQHEEFWEVFIDNESSSFCGDRHVYAIANTEKEANAIMRILEWRLAQALNAPVLATEEVLAGLPMSADVYTLDEKTGDALKCTFDDEYGWRCRAGFLNEALELGKPYRIFTIKDPKTLEYFLQFYTDGTLIKGKETNDD